MSLPSGTKLGPYEIVSPLGAGGLDTQLYAVDTSARNNEFIAENVRPLLAIRNAFPNGTPFEPDASGRRFLVAVPSQGSTSPIELITNWTAALNK